MRIIILILFALLTSAALAGKPQYAIIIDAGSSGSRLHLFQYQTDSVIPVIDDIFSEKTTPGLSSFANHPEEAPASLKKLLDDAQKELAKRHIAPAQVSISIMGTAGMRLLPDQTQAAIYSQLNTYLKNHYSFTPKTIATISGKMEGVYGWLDINYLTKRFNVTVDKTVGSIDMGGASTQIAFSTKDTSKSTDEIELRIGGRTYTVFSESFLGLGQDQARNSIDENTLAAACYPTNFSLSNHSKGNFNLATCKKIYADLIQQHHVQEMLLMPSAKQHFIAYSAIYAVDHFLNVDKTPDKASVEMRIQSVCNTSWEQLKAQNPTVPEKYLAGYCANATYDSDLLYDTYQLQGSQLSIANQLNGHDIDWTLGALLFSLI